MTTIAERLFDQSTAEYELEDLLSEAGVAFSRLGWDSYDMSLVSLKDVRTMKIPT